MTFTETVSSAAAGTGLSEALLLDLKDMPALPCESRFHGNPGSHKDHDDGPATHYAQFGHDCPGMGRRRGEIYAICTRRAARLNWVVATGTGVRCMSCKSEFPDARDFIFVVGPIGGSR